MKFRNGDDVCRFCIAQEILFLGERILCRDDLQRRPITSLVSQDGESEALGGQIDRTTKGIHIIGSPSRVLKCTLEINYQFALGVIESHIGQLQSQL